MTKCMKFLKQNLFFTVVLIAYIGLGIFAPDKGMQGILNSGYYIKEMLMIMPVIFVLTALLDTWVPKETIIRLLGKEAGVKGVILAFVLGSISAGPIYAAFPFCVMLRRKGTSIRNIIIILSSWAVVKVPMLLNEAKFLGPKFMAVRWLLTVIAIIIFSWIAARIVKEEDFPELQDSTQEEIHVDKKACIGCKLCVKSYPELFEIENNKAQIKPANGALDLERAQAAAKACPVKAIHL